MKTAIARALALDALYQVVDNRVFRLLALLVVLLVLPTFLVGAREERLVVLFGWREYYYEDIFANFGMPFPGLGEAHRELIRKLQEILVDHLAGTVGILFCVAATAFFVPRMLEKGAADALFTKPIGRSTLLFARYAAGLLFVALLAALLVGGIHVGLLVNSGYSDPGFLWTIPILVYLFAQLSALSVLVGVVTRSTVAAILTTILFYGFTSCTHQLWEIKESQVAERSLTVELRNPNARETEALDRFERYLLLVLDVAHYTLPKTNDASLIAQELRDQLSGAGPELFDSETELSVLSAPEGFERTSDDLTGDGALWRDVERDASLRLRRRPYEGEEDLTERVGRKWQQCQVASGADALRAALEADPTVEELRLFRRHRASWADDDAWTDSSREVAQRTTAILAWRRAERAYETAIFGDYPKWLYVLESEAPAALAEDQDFQAARRGFEASFQFHREKSEAHPSTWYERRFGWDAELKFNIWFSILSTLGFVALTFALAAWRLARIDF